MISMKRLFDIIISFSALIVFLPIFVFTAILVKFKLGSPVIFKHMRPGLRGMPFTMYKFRSLTNEKDQRGHLLPDAKRLTRFGSLLRSSSLDELPELINVLKGEMSIVGPRPLLMQYLEKYDTEQARRHDVNPGITGWAQVNGRNAIEWEEKFNLDVWYVDNQSFLLDIKILLMTVVQVFKREGISQEGHATAEEFMGNNYHGK